jgi:hypothetical protein
LPHLPSSKLPFKELHRIRQWQVAHSEDHPLEFELWDAVITVWLMAWVGCLPMVALEAWWVAPLCALGIMSPQLYVGWRARAHAREQLRCDWLPASYLPQTTDERVVY